MDNTETIKQEVQGLLTHMGYVCVEPIEVKERDGRVGVSFSVGNPYELIGEGGKNLSAFQHIARLCVARKIPSAEPVDIDVNSYKKRREEFITELARQAGERARFARQQVELEPMSPFDRRVIHCTVAEYSDLISESVGEGLQRRVVIRPYP